MSTKQKLLGAVIALALLLIGIFSMGLYNKSSSDTITNEQKDSQNVSGVKVVSTVPDNLDNGVVPPTSTIELTFNKPLVRDDTRIVLDPKTDYRTDLSSDHKTLKIIPGKSFDLGKDYTLTIKQGYGTDTGEKTDSDIIFHFKTVEYNGV
jgi:hypothetical protein